jgi:hypothetical protein
MKSVGVGSWAGQCVEHAARRRSDTIGATRTVAQEDFTKRNLSLRTGDLDTYVAIKFMWRPTTSP